nr:helix-turn-helix domain-containing protein [Qipengyuania qiaonensis]
MAGMKPRTFERFCKRHFGFAPSALLRRQRFLRSLGKYMLDPSMRWIGSLDTHYWDQAHFIREFRATMNMKPSEFAALPHPISGAAVRLTSMRAGVTMQALYHPDRSRN